MTPCKQTGSDVIPYAPSSRVNHNKPAAILPPCSPTSLNLQPSALNPQPSALNPQPSALNQDSELLHLLEKEQALWVEVTGEAAALALSSQVT